MAAFVGHVFVHEVAPADARNVLSHMAPHGGFTSTLGQDPTTAALSTRVSATDCTKQIAVYYLGREHVVNTDARQRLQKELGETRHYATPGTRPDSRISPVGGAFVLGRTVSSHYPRTSRIWLE